MLEDILASTATRVRRLTSDEEALRTAAEAMPPVRDFSAALRAEGLQVIAEIKRRSPSAGVLAADLDPALQARMYETGGAAAISVLTEPDFFDGSLADLVAVRAAVTLPVLRKDFLIDPVQIAEARAAGADAVLLIVAALDDEALLALLDAARQFGLAALVEAHTLAEAQRAVDAGAEIIGVNNRDLRTFATDLATAETVYPVVSGAAVRIAESGVSDVAGATRMAAAGYDAILVGEALVRSADPGGLLQALRGVSG